MRCCPASAGMLEGTCRSLISVTMVRSRHTVDADAGETTWTPSSGLSAFHGGRSGQADR
jgi:hypothetical protein